MIRDAQVARLLGCARMSRQTKRVTVESTESLLGADAFRMIWCCRSRELLLGYLPTINDALLKAEVVLYF